MFTLITGNALEVLQRLPTESVQSVITSPPYYALRDYGITNQIGAEKSLDDYVANLVEVFTEAKRVLKSGGTLWLNLGDSYVGGGVAHGGTGRKSKTQGNPEFNKNRPSRELTKLGTQGQLPTECKPKDLCGVPWRVAFALQKAGWYLRSDIIWHKPNPMPESVNDRPTKSHEYLFLFSKSPTYYYNADAIKEPAKWERWGKQTIKKDQPGAAKWLKEKTIDELPVQKYKNKRDVWTVPVASYKGAHFATFPVKLIEPCVLAGSQEGDLILDPFSGAATTGLVALSNHRHYVGVDLNSEYNHLGQKRIRDAIPDVQELSFGVLNIVLLGSKYQP